MSHLTPINWKIFERFLLFVGCRLVRTKGDHRIYERVGLRRPLVIKIVKDLPIFIIRNNIRELGIEPEEYLEILKQL